MGCDIHEVIEYAENGIYYSFDLGWGFSRDYFLFAMLGYNRWGYSQPRFPPRGIPSDCSQKVRQDFFCSNEYHTYWVKIEPGAVDEAQLRKNLEEGYRNGELNYYEETNIVPVSVFTHWISEYEEYIDDELKLKGIYASYSDWAPNQYKLTDLFCRKDEAGLKGFLESYGDWAVKEYEATGLIPICDYHTPSWLNFNELKEAAGYSVDSEFEEGEKAESEIQMVLTVMQGLAKKYGNENVRLVFWFDN